LLKAISGLFLFAQVLFPTVGPAVDRSDANARAAGSDKAAAVRVGSALFATQWPAQVLSVYADGAGGHDVVGLRISGKHFHGTLTRAGLAAEIAALAARSFAAVPAVEEVDAWVSMPLEAKDLVVVSDVNRPTYRTVFTISVRRGETPASVISRIRTHDGTYEDQEWERSALK
jgi:hypothetical protein